MKVGTYVNLLQSARNEKQLKLKSGKTFKLKDFPIRLKRKNPVLDRRQIQGLFVQLLPF